jgi:uncharacterized protein Smg (DUF494 family)
MLLVKAYPQGNYIHFAETASDNAEDKGPNAESNVNTELNRSVYTFQVVSDQGRDTPINYWTKAYEAIAIANHALEAIERLGPDNPAYLPYKGEALLCRAYAHFMLVTFFSEPYRAGQVNNSPGIPYVTEPEKVVQPRYERRTVDYVYEMIEKDLTEGLPLIDNSKFQQPKYHFNTSAAHAFASRFYLFKGDDNQVLYHSNLVVPDGNYNGYLRPWISEYNGWDTGETRERYGNADQRSNLLILETTSLWGNQYYYYRFGLTLDVHSSLMTAVNATGAPWGQRTSSYTSSIHRRHNKFYSYNVRTSLTSSTITRRVMVPALTTEESLFNRAEAYVNKDQLQKAIDDLNLYASERITNYNADAHGLTLAKIENFYSLEGKAAVLKAILDFKRSEFAQEGLRWFDVIRHDIPIRHRILTIYGTTETTIEVPAGDLRRVFQLPEEVKLAGIELNPRP